MNKMSNRIFICLGLIIVALIAGCYDYEIFVNYSPDYSNILVYMDNGGGEIDKVYAVKFTPDQDESIGGSWGKPVLLSNEDYNAYNPQIAFSPNGDAIAVFVQFDGDYDRIYACRYSAEDDKWSNPQIIDAETGAIADYPRVAFNLEGNAMVVFAQNTDAYDRVYATLYNAKTKKWSTPQIIDNGDDETGYAPWLFSFDAEGNGFCIYSEQTLLYGVRYDKNSGWEAESSFLGVNENRLSLNPSFAFDANGNALCVFMERKDGFGGPLHLSQNNTKSKAVDDYYTYARYYKASTNSWGNAQDIGRGEDAYSGWVAFNPDGDALCLFSEEDDDGFDNIVARWFKNGSWEEDTEEFYSGTATNSGYSPIVAFDLKGKAHAAFYTFNTNDNITRVYGRDYDGTQWGDPQLLSYNNGYSVVETSVSLEGYPLPPQIVVDSNDNGFCIFKQITNGDDNVGIFFNRFY